MFRNTFAHLFVLTAATAVLAGTASAQTKVGVISMQQAVLQTAEIKKASAELEAKYKPRSNDIERIRKEVEDIQQKLQAGSGKMAPAAESELTAQGQRKQRELQRMTQDLQEEVDAVRNEVLMKSGQKMQGIVQKLAEERGLDVVVDAGSTLFVKPALDLTKDAVAAFDAAYPAK